MQGDHVRLLPGQPVLQSTSLQTLCKNRNKHGVCTGDEADWKRTQSQFFTYIVSKSDYYEGMQLTISISRDCEGGRCDMPIQMYLYSCHKKDPDCRGQHRYPSEFEHMLELPPSNSDQTTIVSVYKIETHHLKLLWNSIQKS